MMKARSQRTVGGDGQAASGSSRAAKSDALIGANGVGGAGANQAASSAQARKRRSSINVYDQPSSLNSRLRQLETDMLRLDEDRTKLFDDTHSALAQYELKLGEIHAILKSRQDNVEKYVEDMRTLLTAKDEFEKQTKMLNEKHDRIHEKFMHRETIISREIKLLKNKFEALEKNRQFRTMLQKSNIAIGGGAGDNVTTSDDLTSNLDGSERNRSETGTMSGFDSASGAGKLSSMIGAGAGGGARGNRKSVRIKMSNFGGLGSLFGFSKRSGASKARRKSNKVSSISGDMTPAGHANCLAGATTTEPDSGPAAAGGELKTFTEVPAPTPESALVVGTDQPGASALPSESQSTVNGARLSLGAAPDQDAAVIGGGGGGAKNNSFFSRLFKGK